MRISSPSTFFYKRVFPFLWFGALAAMATVAYVGGQLDRTLVACVFVGMSVVASFGLMLALKGLADEVLDHGDELVVRVGDRKERIPLANVMNVSSSLHTRPPRITLRLITPGAFGARVVFLPKGGYWNLRGESPMAEDLAARAHRARSRDQR